VRTVSWLFSVADNTAPVAIAQHHEIQPVQAYENSHPRVAESNLVHEATQGHLEEKI
jgi:hypothetical protein